MGLLALGPMLLRVSFCECIHFAVVVLGTGEFVLKILRRNVVETAAAPSRRPRADRDDGVHDPRRRGDHVLEAHRGSWW